MPVNLKLHNVAQRSFVFVDSVAVFNIIPNDSEKGCLFFCLKKERFFR